MADQKPYIATEALFVDEHNYVRAHNPGDVVPAENVKANGWESGVAREGTKAADQAVEDADSQPSPATTAKK